MRVVATGSNIRVYVDNMVSPVLNVTDSTYTSGSIGLRAMSANTQFDNMIAVAP